MATQAHDTAAPAQRRLLLIDFDWQDADLIPDLFQRPEVSVRLVAGDGPQDPGVRIADLCGLPRTLDLADLTREIFDVALVGERSSRRTQLESLLVALGTPCVTPEEYLRGPGAADDASRPGVDASLALHAAALEQSLAGGTDALVDQALPGLDEPTPLEPRAVEPGASPRSGELRLDDFPSAETRLRLEDALKELVTRTGAGTAEVHAGDRSQLRLMAQIGPEDRLLKGLVELASDMGTPQVVTRMTDPGRGRTWAAWPFRTMQRRGVLAGASIDASEGLGSWHAMLEELRNLWDREDHARSVASFPLTPNREARWLDHEAFRERVTLAVERHRRDGLRFELHRLEFPESRAVMARLAAALPGEVRDTDCLSQPFPHIVTLLAACEPEAFAQLRRRLLAAWEKAWVDAGMPPPVAAFVDRHLALSGPEDAEAFLTSADVWLAEP
ncbi:MAG TPA: hypothetical protein VI504_09025 [Candidatus Eisenbacteria bacterium]|jgi:hypothetical protein